MLTTLARISCLREQPTRQLLSFTFKSYSPQRQANSCSLQLIAVHLNMAKKQRPRAIMSILLEALYICCVGPAGLYSYCYRWLCCTVMGCQSRRIIVDECVIYSEQHAQLKQSFITYHTETKKQYNKSILTWWYC